MGRVVGLAVAAGAFLASFALHIVGGATDQGWLFAVAVGLIYATATGFGAIAWIVAGAKPSDRITLVLGLIVGAGLTASALWAANGRSFAWWEVPAGIGLAAVSSVGLAGAWGALNRGRPGSSGDSRVSEAA